MVEAQKWLKDNYENEENKKSKTVEIKFNKNEGIKLSGELVISDYSNLKKISLVGAKEITKLVINKCSNVEEIYVPDNQITEIKGLAGLANLQTLSFSNNKVKEIDISENKQLETLTFLKNPKNLKFVNGIRGLSKLVFWHSKDTFAITTLLEQASGEDLREIAEGLKLDVNEKTPEEMKGIIKNEVDKIEQNKTKLNQEFPNLISGENEIDGTKLEEIKNNIDKGREYQKLVDETTNTPVVENGKIDQTKLTDKLEKADDYEKLVEDNKPDLTTEDGKKMDQKKIDDLKTASGDAAEAIKILGVNLKPDTLNAILGGSKLSDIRGPETLKSILESKEKLENALKSIGINPNDANIEEQIEIINNLKEKAEALFGEEYGEVLKVQKYQNQVEVNTNNKI